jgi:ABC-2 type transport system ATP-binding protein
LAERVIQAPGESVRQDGLLHAEPDFRPGPASELQMRAVVVNDVSRSFGQTKALDHVSLAVARGTIHALLGPNGAGKTTLLRILTGLVEPSSGSVRVLGVDAAANHRTLKRVVGLVPSGDRSFYLRISALENLVFFARLYGHSRREALARARETLDGVDLLEVADRSVGTFSHGMQKRLSVARALLHRPEVLLIDEATHDLDPLAARAVRALARSAADRGAAVLWATQRIDEIRGFADQVTVLDHGRLRLTGSVARLMSFAEPDRYLLVVRNWAERRTFLKSALETQLCGRAELYEPAERDGDTLILILAPGLALGDALAVLLAGGAEIVRCTEAQSEVEGGFLALLEQEAT